MLKATVTITGSKEFLRQLKQIEHLDLTDIGELVRQRMIDIIDENRKTDIKQPEQRYPEKPYSKHISDILTVEVKSNGVGIGNIEKLNKEVPYWRLVNDGGAIKGTPHGVFLGGAGSSFQFGPGPKMTPTNKIAPMNYIQKTQAWINQNLKRFLQDKISKAFSKTNFKQRSLIRLK